MSEPVPPRADRQWRFYVEDMLRFSRKIMEYSAQLDFQAFDSGGQAFDAILRNLELIGEAATHVPEDARARNPGIPWRRLVATRNRLIHGYLGLDNDTLWSLVRSDVPALADALAGLQEGKTVPAGAPTAFRRYVGIDYSGAQTPTSSLKGLRVYLVDGDGTAAEVAPPPSPRKYWTRRGIAEWLAAVLSEDRSTIVGIDHGFSFPLRYFESHQIPPEWPAFLEDFQRHWPTDEDHVYVDFVRHGSVGNGDARGGSSRWRRISEMRARSAKSVFHFDVQGSVAKSTHAGIPWLLYLRQRCGDRLHFWPFDGWQVPDGHSAVAEVYPSLWKHLYPGGDRTPDQQDAYTIACWLRDADRSGQLASFMQPPLSPQERTIATVEGWILGVKDLPRVK
ncbi:MAG: HepT-like ribonuclease domain-containing protein [bacterium]